jgi:flavin reductase (DIM6/NTAB) family NADH-FMN oxidoreductase RutF
MDALVSQLSHREIYDILLHSVGPRPIAWVSSVSGSGDPNVAPFSFFNCVSVDPPMLAFSPGLRAPKDAPSAPHGEPKDTLRNIRETKEFVVSVVTYDLRDAMNATSGEYDATVNEFELAKLTPQPSQVVRPPRVAESPVSFECKLHQIIDFSPKPTGSSLVIGHVVAVHIDDANLKDGRIDADSLDLIGRMGGLQYTRTINRFEMVRPKVE